MLFEPGGGLGIEMVGGLVEQQQDRASSAAARQSATRRFSPPESLVDIGVARRAAQRINGHLDLRFEVPQVLGVDQVLEFRSLSSAVSSE